MASKHNLVMGNVSTRAYLCLYLVFYSSILFSFFYHLYAAVMRISHQVQFYFILILLLRSGISLVGKVSQRRCDTLPLFFTLSAGTLLCERLEEEVMLWIFKRGFSLCFKFMNRQTHCSLLPKCKLMLIMPFIWTLCIMGQVWKRY